MHEVFASSFFCTPLRRVGSNDITPSTQEESELSHSALAGGTLEAREVPDGVEGKRSIWVSPLDYLRYVIVSGQYTLPSFLFAMSTVSYFSLFYVRHSHIQQYLHN